MHINGDNVNYQIDQSQSEELVSDVLRSNSDFVVTSKPKRGRPHKSGRALEIGEVKTEIATKKKESKNVKVKRLIQFQPISHTD